METLGRFKGLLCTLWWKCVGSELLLVWMWRKILCVNSAMAEIPTSCTALSHQPAQPGQTAAHWLFQSALYFLPFVSPPFLDLFLPRIFKTDSLILHPIGWSKLFWVSFTSHEAVASGGCTEIILCRTHSILGTKILNPGCGSQG